jgi:acyl-coenzyme A synthetase/AMP-(fatty) acid ligase
LRYSLFCGEAFNKHLAKSWQRAAPETRVINLYGPTEATIAISSYEYPKEGEPAARNGVLSIGKIFPGQQYRIEAMDKDSTTGELMLAGTQVVSGYFRNEEMTSKAFAEIDGRRWYRTGDVAEEDDSGHIYFLGRKDQEIKFHGYRINLLEIDHTIRKYFRLDEVVTVFDTTKGQGQIVSFITYPSRKGVSRQQVLETCKERLPWYMVPEKIIFVEKMPVNINGKIDRAALKKRIT